jgi:hypothetical protein
VMSKPHPISEEIASVWLTKKAGNAPTRNKIVASPGENKPTNQETASQAASAAV